MRRVLAVWIAATALLPSASEAQIAIGQGVNDYQARYGDPVEVSLDDLAQDPASYQDRAVRTKGRLDFSAGVGARAAYALRSTFGLRLRLVPVPEIGGFFEDEAPRLVGEPLEVTGVVRTPRNSTDAANAYFEFWSFIGDERDDGKPVSANTVTLEELVTRPGKLDGRTVRVVGKFRGRNLYGDMPAKSGDGSDWVIKDDVFAAWVTGKKPKGSGWALDPSLKRDTGRWLEVVGRVETRGKLVFLHAKRLALSEPPRPAAEAQPPPPPPERPKVPPSLVFSLPLDGEGAVARDSRFVVQFSKDMDEASFGGRVGLRYPGPRRPGDRDFDGLKMTYDGGLRALTVDPGDLLRPGRDLELVLLGGILDVEGLELVPRNGLPHDGVVDVLRYRVSP